ncbi:MAG: MGDG synthase family glycosyltransferase [Methylocystaceae bacterium]
MESVLIFSASTGGGHNQVAAVLKKEFVLHGYNVEIHDFLKESNRFLNLVIADGYNHLAASTFPLFGVLYKTSDKKIIYQRLHRILSLFLSDQILEIIRSSEPDLIVVTHPMIVNVLGDLKARGYINIPIMSVVTDFNAHQSYVNNYIDAYITASERAAQTLNQRGIPRYKIYTHGIPVDSDFRENTWVNKDLKPLSILLMGGSMGAKPIDKTLRALLEVPHPLRIMVVCANNQHLKTRLEEMYLPAPSNKDLAIYGFVPDIAGLMDEADVIFTKPGGITTSEAIAKGVPMIIPFYIPGPEQQNTQILVECGVAIQVSGARDIQELVTKFIQNPEVLSQLADNMKRLSSMYSLENTMELAEQLIDNFTKMEYHA